MNDYPDNWKEIAERIKRLASYKCERCDTPDSKTPDGNCLTVHHLVRDKSLNEDWNLAALCQRCHLLLEHLDMNSVFNPNQLLFVFFEVPIWFYPHLQGFIQWKAKQSDSRATSDEPQ